MRSAGKIDKVFFAFVLVICVFGLASLFSASAPLGIANFNSPYYFVGRQLLFGFLPGIAAVLFINYLGYEKLRNLSWIIYAISLVFLALSVMPGFGVVINGSRNWLRVGGFTFQPSEISKLAVVIILAYLLSAKKYDWSDWQQSLLPLFAILAPTLGLVLFQDLGTFSIIIMAVLAMLILAKMPFKYLAVISLIGVVCFSALVWTAPYRAKRITTFLHPELDPKGQGYQINQSFLAVGSGGLWGLGYYNSRQKYQYLPEVNSDMVFSIVAEEDGFVVSTIVVIILLLFLWRGLKIARSTPDEFGSLLVSGIMVWFGWQAFLNIGGAVGALPLTGVPLPFVSHGGSALAVALAGAGVVMNVSREAKLG